MIASLESWKFFFQCINLYLYTGNDIKWKYGCFNDDRLSVWSGWKADEKLSFQWNAYLEILSLDFAIYSLLEMMTKCVWSPTSPSLFAMCSSGCKTDLSSHPSWIFSKLQICQLAICKYISLLNWWKLCKNCDCCPHSDKMSQWLHKDVLRGRFLV